MEIEYLRHNQINREKWDEAVKQSHNRLIYAFSWYLDLVAPGWDALVSVDYEYIMPLTKGSKLGVKYLVQPLAQQLGIFSRSTISQKEVEAFLSAIPKKFLYFNFHLNYSNPITPAKKINTSVRKTYLLPLNRPYEDISKKYHKYRRKNVRKGQQAGFELKESLAANELVDFYKKHLQDKITHISNIYYLMLQRLIEGLLKRKKLYVKEAWLNGELMGTLAVAMDKPYCFYLHGAASPKGKQLYVTEFLLDHFFEQHAGQPLIFDFEGSMIPGIAYYYQSFGAHESLYLQVQGNQIPLLWRWGKK